MLKELIKEILKDEISSKTTAAQTSTDTNDFIVVGKSYAFRTITMIYTGKVKAISQCGKEILLEKAAWIADTERWHKFVNDLSAKEIEVYSRNVVICRGSFLDYFEVDENDLPTETK